MSYTPDEKALIEREMAAFWTNYTGLLNDAKHIAEERGKESGDNTPPWHKISMRDGVITLLRMKIERLVDCTPDKCIEECKDIINYAGYLAAYTLMVNNIHPPVVTSQGTPPAVKLEPVDQTPHASITAAQALAAREVKK